MDGWWWVGSPSANYILSLTAIRRRYQGLEPGVKAKGQMKKATKRRSSAVALTARPVQSSLAETLLLDLADRLDPPVKSSLELVWQEPPDIVDWAHGNFIDPITNRLVQLAEHQQRLFRAILKLIWAKKVNTVVWSEVKKSGKTTAAAVVGAYWANYVEPPNLVISVANDKEQAAGRIYAAMMPTLARLGWEVPERMPLMENKMTGSKVSAISTNYAGEAGANYGLTLWSELWAYTSESRKRLWEEMTQVPTRQFSVRWVETYAGYLGESELLWELYTRAFKDGKEEDPLGEKIAGVEDLPVWYIPSSHAVVLWSHEPRMSWQTPEFIESQRNAPGMRPNTFLRLWGNYWVSSESVFIDPTQWDVLEDCEPLNPEGDVRPIVLGVDASTKHDSSAIVAAAWNPDGKAPDIVGAWEYKPRYSEAADKVIVDLSATIETKLVELFETYQVLGVYYDQLQLHSIMTNLQKKYDSKNARKVFVDFPQNSGRIESDQAFYVWITERKLRRIRHVGLRTHVLNAVAEETERGFRLDKEKTDQKIDLAVAASMACYGVSVRQRPFRKFISLATVGKRAEPAQEVT